LNADVLFLFIYLVALLIGFAITAMAIWHTWLIATSQTTVEQYINEYKKSQARAAGQSFVNEYDLGTIRNFQEFFNIGTHRHWITIFIPMRIPPRSDGQYYPTVQQLFREESFHL
jgi:palmitoyltransferase